MDRAVIWCFWSQLSWENCWTNSGLSQFKSGGFATDFGVTPTRGNNQTQKTVGKQFKESHKYVPLVENAKQLQVLGNTKALVPGLELETSSSSISAWSQCSVLFDGCSWYHAWSTLHPDLETPIFLQFFFCKCLKRRRKLTKNLVTVGFVLICYPLVKATLW